MPDSPAALADLATTIASPHPALPSLDAHWMPFTANRAFKRAPRLLVAAEGMHYTTHDGRTVLDAVAGLWCVNAGHGRRRITEAIAHQAATMDFAPGFQMGHPLSFAVAERVAAIAPAGMDRVFFTNSGSEAVDTALKMALAYHRARGEPERVRFVGRARGYHGVGFGGLSVGGIANNRAAFAAQALPHVDHLPDTHDLARNAFSPAQPLHGAERADALLEVIARHGAHAIAAVIVEPVAGSTGVLLPPVGYLERLRAICDAHGILLVFDEVITGFGRLGAPFAAQRFGVVPDLITVAKGITNGAVPMGAVIASRAVHDAIVGAASPGIEFFHGYTYSGHPLACAAALATLETYEEERLLSRALAMEDTWRDALHGLRGAPHVIDVRTLGLVGAVEVAPREGAPGARAFEIFTRCYEAGLLVRQTGDVIAMSPPLVVEPAHVKHVVAVLSDVLGRVA
jgi:beta-alanine--pyruvate transaminase